VRVWATQKGTLWAGLWQVKKKTRSAGSPGQAGLPKGAWAEAGRIVRRRATIGFISPSIGGLWNILYI
jgi:hypothetical protein